MAKSDSSKGKKATSSSPVKGATRERSRSRGRPMGSKNKERSTSRGRPSAAARPASKSRRSTSRTRTPTRTVSSARKSPARNKSPARGGTKSEPVKKVEKKETPAQQPKEKKEVKKVETPVVEKGGLTRRKSSRIAALEAEHKATPVKVVPGKVSFHVEKRSATSWLAILGAVVCTLSIPAFIFGVNSMCDKKNCTVRMLPLPTLKRLVSYYDKNAWLAYFGFALVQAILVLLPLGRRSKKYHRFNGWISFFVTLGSIFLFHRFNVPLDILRVKFFPLMAAAWVLGFVLSVAVYIKTRVAPGNNEHSPGQTGNIIVDWHAGRETTPRLGNWFDLKIYGLRLAGNGLVLIHGGLLYLAYMKSGWDLPPQFIASAVIGVFYSMDFLLREQDYLTTYDYLKTGTGHAFFACVNLAPFTTSLTTRFLYDQIEAKQLVEMPKSCLAALLTVYIVGYVLYLVANRMKNRFRRDPNSKDFANLETIPTNRGKALIVSAPWGWLRHPNYVGNIIMFFASTALTGFHHVLPYIFPVFMSLFLVFRAREDESRLQKKYGSSWNRYCTRVPYRFIPKVY